MREHRGPEPAGELEPDRPPSGPTPGDDASVVVFGRVERPGHGRRRHRSPRLVTKRSGQPEQGVVGQRHALVEPRRRRTRLGQADADVHQLALVGRSGVLDHEQGRAVLREIHPSPNPFHRSPSPAASTRSGWSKRVSRVMPPDAPLTPPTCRCPAAWWNSISVLIWLTVCWRVRAGMVSLCKPIRAANQQGSLVSPPCGALTGEQGPYGLASTMPTAPGLATGSIKRRRLLWSVRSCRRICSSRTSFSEGFSSSVE
jgi:hypothetical protein